MESKRDRQQKKKHKKSQPKPYPIPIHCEITDGSEIEGEWVSNQEKEEQNVKSILGRLGNL